MTIKLKNLLQLCFVAALLGLPAFGLADRTYEYDALGRLTRIVRDNGAVTEYVYDAAGNILSTQTSYPNLVGAVINFDEAQRPAGTILSRVNAAAAKSAIGPIGVQGTLPSSPKVNSAVIFDSANPTGDDRDLGTPNETYGGPGRGAGGEKGQLWPNNQAQHNLLIIAENLIDTDKDGLVDDPDDANEAGMYLDFDFSHLSKSESSTVTLVSFRTIDFDLGAPPNRLILYGAGDLELANFELASSGDNSARTHRLGPEGLGINAVQRMRLVLGGSGAIDDISFFVNAALVSVPSTDV